VPISLRQEGDTTANNQVAGTLIDLGTEIADPAERLKAIKRGTAAMKKQMGTFRGVIPTDFPSLGSPWLISGLASLYGRSRIADWLRITNVTISNVPGSRVPVYLCGARMTDYYPLSIVVHGIALNITVQSHVDQLCFGLIACRRAVPDVHLLGEHLQRAMASLRVLVAPALAASATTATAAMPATPATAAAKPAKSAAPGRAKTRRPRAETPARAAAPAQSAAPARQPRLRVVAANARVAPAKNAKPAKSARPAKPRRPRPIAASR
jgi:pyruvate/2-oxoglutarate dehydrogenase complex dihydrolipoamide acyltransferase (E2) component